MAIKTTRVTVGTTRTRLGPATNGAGYSAGPSLAIQAPADFYIGGPDVTAENGFLVAGGGPVTLDLSINGEPLFAITAAGDVVVSVLQQGA